MTNFSMFEGPGTISEIVSDARPGIAGLPDAGETDSGMGPQEDDDNAFPDN